MANCNIIISDFYLQHNTSVAVLLAIYDMAKSRKSIPNCLEAEIGLLLGSRYHYIHKEFNSIMSKTVRASSIVEYMNSLIRPYLFLKKAVPGKFLALLQFYFNTRPYRRSRKADRVDKSPVEMLTGKTYLNPIAILGY